ncbi:aspartate/glutamate racemase family protein [Aquipseudomonas ullengensis]|uniref:Aspartate/glutamate racemase family protein n=1 Tax=Aquipseudomonas ullengensis TaxID=2759166 RepID=A0A7W4QAU6_9GAMM|nr:aspartate/glutamate racemase family protein [Pseudomonas ullengensis]MBB2496034.1 aspartate/glutamate racemase family protein [Pseudomonas ullengensis]
MKTIGLIGGMSWESTAVYYREINERMRKRHGGLVSADILLRSVDFSQVVALQQAGRWDQAGADLAHIGQQLEKAGAACVLICTNTMHKVADAVAQAIGVPLLHIVDVTGAALQQAGMRRPLLLATRYTMEQNFYHDRLAARFGIEALVPDEPDRTLVHEVIFNQLCQGVVCAESKQAFLDVIARGKAAGADSVILGCTEIGLLIGLSDGELPVFDSTYLHAQAAVDFSDGVAAI